MGQASEFKARVVWGTGRMLKGLERDGAFPRDVDGWGEGVRMGMTFIPSFGIREGRSMEAGKGGMCPGRYKK